MPLAFERMETDGIGQLSSLPVEDSDERDGDRGSHRVNHLIPIEVGEEWRKPTRKSVPA